MSRRAQPASRDVPFVMWPACAINFFMDAPLSGPGSAWGSGCWSDSRHQLDDEQPDLNTPRFDECDTSVSVPFGLRRKMGPEPDDASPSHEDGANGQETGPT
ncbi:hypothetical protein ABZP36_005059 [Zizania latifolia]